MQPKIIGKLKLIDSKIESKDESNVIFCDDSEGEVVLEKSTITFNGSNSLVFLTKGKESLKIKTTLNSNNILYIGKNTSFHKSSSTHIIIGDSRAVIIGDDCLFSRDVYIRTSDAHIIYSTKTFERVNYSKDVLIGDHVWIGQDVMILKGATIGSGAIVGSKSLVPSKTLYSNTSYGGSPIKQISGVGEVFFTKKGTNNLTPANESKYDKNVTDSFIYNEKGNCLNLIESISTATNVVDKIEILKKIPKDKNRFAILPNE